MNRSHLPLILAGVVTILGVAALAGPLDPPAGPIAPTYKTLAEVEPRIAINAVNTPGDATNTYRVTQPGSYYLTANITGAAGKNGIAIQASNVTLDLNGFQLVGGINSADGIVAGAFVRTTLRNGSVSGWGRHGVNLFSVDESVIVDVGSGDNTGGGFVIGEHAVLTRCNAARNHVNGFRVISATMSDCFASDNQTNGFVLEQKGLFSRCVATSNVEDGFHANISAEVVDCAAYDNQVDGIDCGVGTTIRGCTVRQNHLNGIVCGSSSLVQSNLLSENGFDGIGSGIRVSGANSRIEGNNCTDADIGIYIAAAGNVVVRNTCANNTLNWSIVANNIFGPIIDRTAPGTSAISGNSASGTMGSSDTNANFSY